MNRDELDRDEAIEGELVGSVPMRRGGRPHGPARSPKSLRRYLIGGVLLLLLPAILLIAFILGAGYLSEQLLPLLLASVVPLLIITLVLIPLSRLPAWRTRAIRLTYASSFLYGITAWMLAFIITLQHWGVLAVILGLLILGVGVVPIGLLAALFNGEWGVLLNIVVLLTLAAGFRQWALNRRLQ
ncbi:MAG: hypothetical protein WD467_00660 [Candidatus Saccharimonadales bacterium]